MVSIGSLCSPQEWGREAAGKEHDWKRAGRISVPMCPHCGLNCHHMFRARPSTVLDASHMVSARRGGPSLACQPSHAPRTEFCSHDSAFALLPVSLQLLTLPHAFLFLCSSILYIREVILRRNNKTTKYNHKHTSKSHPVLCLPVPGFRGHR